MKGRVFCVRSQSELIALDGDTGASTGRSRRRRVRSIPTSGSAPSGLCFRSTSPISLLVLRTDDGRPITRRGARGERACCERPPMPVDENSVLLVSDRRTVKTIRPRARPDSWVYRESERPAGQRAAAALRHAERLLVLHDGRSLIRLDPATGSKRWACFLGMRRPERAPGLDGVRRRNGSTA